MEQVRLKPKINTTYHQGDILEAIYTEGSKILPGSLFLVKDPEKYPLQRKELINKVGYNDAKFFICVEDLAHRTVGYYMVTRFRKVADKKRGKA